MLTIVVILLIGAVLVLVSAVFSLLRGLQDAQVENLILKATIEAQKHRANPPFTGSAGDTLDKFLEGDV